MDAATDVQRYLKPSVALHRQLVDSGWDVNSVGPDQQNVLEHGARVTDKTPEFAAGGGNIAMSALKKGKRSTEKYKKNEKLDLTGPTLLETRPHCPQEISVDDLRAGISGEPARPRVRHEALFTTHDTSSSAPSFKGSLYRSKDERVRKNSPGVAIRSPARSATTCVKCLVLCVSNQL